MELGAQGGHATRVEVEEGPLHEEGQGQEHLAGVVWAPDAQYQEVDQSGEGKGRVHGDVLELGEVIEGAVWVSDRVQLGVSARCGWIGHDVHTFHHDAYHRTEDFDDGFQGHRSAEGLRDPGSLAHLVLTSFLLVEGKGKGGASTRIPAAFPALLGVGDSGVGCLGSTPFEMAPNGDEGPPDSVDNKEDTWNYMACKGTHF